MIWFANPANQATARILSMSYRTPRIICRSWWSLLIYIVKSTNIVRGAWIPSMMICRIIRLRYTNHGSNSFGINDMSGLKDEFLRLLIYCILLAHHDTISGMFCIVKCQRTHTWRAHNSLGKYYFEKRGPIVVLPLWAAATALIWSQSWSTSAKSFFWNKMHPRNTSIKHLFKTTHSAILSLAVLLTAVAACRPRSSLPSSVNDVQGLPWSKVCFGTITYRTIPGRRILASIDWLESSNFNHCSIQ